MWREVVGFFAVMSSTLLFAGETELNFYQIMTGNKNNSMTITTQKQGECLRQSDRIKREDAWLCAADGKTYDPCFVQRFGTHTSAVCLDTPWSNTAVEISVAHSLDNSQHETLDMSRTFPWAVELINGEKCEAVNTHDLYDGLPIRYHCSGNTDLMGHVQRCTNNWKMLQHGASGVNTVEIARAWF